MAIPQKSNPLGLPEVIPDAAAAAKAVAAAMVLIDNDPAIREAVGTAVVGNPITVEIVPSADRWASKQIANAVAGAANWVEGVQRPSADFKTAGLAAAGKWKQRVTEAVQQDRFAKGLGKTNTEEAIATAVAVGASGFSSGIQAREAKIRRVVGDLQPRVAAVKRTIDQMPQDTDAQREQRLLAARRGMIEVGKARRG